MGAVKVAAQVFATPPPVIRDVQVSPSPEVSEIVAAVAPAELQSMDAMPASTEPGGGVNAAVVAAVLAFPVVSANAGLDPSTTGVLPPDGGISYTAQALVTDGADDPQVTGVPEVTVPE